MGELSMKDVWARWGDSHRGAGLQEEENGFSSKHALYFQSSLFKYKQLTSTFTFLGI